MADAGSSSLLSSTYWDLHRNTLLFSSLLLILCIPGAHPKADQSFLWVSFSQVSFNGVRLLAFLAATYAISTYWIEWRNEAYSMLRRECELSAHSRDRANQLLDLALNDIQPALGHFRHIIEHAESALSPFTRNDATHTSEEITTIVEATFNEILNDSRHYDNPMNDFLRKVERHALGQKVPTIAYVVENGGRAIKDTSKIVAHASCTKISKESTARLTAILDITTQAATNLQRSLDLLSSQRKGIFYINVNARRAIFLHQAKGWLRIVAIGMIIPMSMYFTAAAHFAGQLGLGNAPSAFSWLQDPLGKVRASDETIALKSQSTTELKR